MRGDEIKRKLEELIIPQVENEGFELVLLEYTAGRNGRLLLIIDREGGINTGHCELISKKISGLLDDEDPISHAYNLEVSSPGLERPLTKKAHFRRFSGSKIRVRTAEALEGRKNFSGILLKTAEDTILLRLDDGREVTIPLDLVARANLSYVKPERR